MLTRAAVGALFFVAAVSAAGEITAPPTPSPADPMSTQQAAASTGSPTPPRQSLHQLWAERRRHRLDGDAEAVGALEQTMREKRRRDGVSRAEDVAGAFVLEGYEEMALGHSPEARAAFHLATEFDPDMPRAYLGLARTEWKGGGGPIAAARSLIDSLRAAARNWLTRTVAAQIVLWGVVVGIPLATVIFVGVLLLRTAPLVHHGLGERLGRTLPPTTAATLARLLPWTPLALPWGAVFTPLIWVGLESPFLNRRERVMAALLLPLAAACAFFALPAASVTAHAIHPDRIHVAGAALGAVGRDRQRALAELLERHPDDAVLHSLYADQCRGLGEYPTALASYRTAVELDPSLRQAYNNAGVLYFSLGQLATSVGEFRKAIDADPRSMTAYYNLYLAQDRRFDFASAEQTLAQARSADPARITALLSAREKRQGRLDALDDRIPVQEALRHAGPGALEGAWPRAWVLGGSTAALCAGAALVLLLAPRRRQERPVRCISCGRVACSRCRPVGRQGDLCVACAALGSRAATVPTLQRESKSEEAAAYRARRTRKARLLAILFPGAGQVWSGRPLVGGTLCMASAIALSIFSLRPVLPVVPYTVLAPGLEPARALAVLLLALLWLFGLLLPLTPAESAPAPAPADHRRT